MATYFKFVIDIYFEELATKYKYDKYFLQQQWDEVNTIMKNMLYNFVQKEYPTMIDKKTLSKICCYEINKKNEIKKCTNKVAGTNRKTCYRHTPELHMIIKQPLTKKEEKKNITCTFVPKKGKYAGIVCGCNVTGSGTICTKHMELSQII